MVMKPLSVVLLLAGIVKSCAFQSAWVRTGRVSVAPLAARGKGFGKQGPPPTPSPPAKSESTSSSEEPSSATSFQSIESGGSDAIPMMEASSPPQMDEQDPSIPAEERAKRLLREKYGLRTLKDKRVDEARRQSRQQMQEWKEKADRGDDFDLIAALPPPVLVAIDSFLKAGLAVCTLLFVGAGIGITAEAWSAASGNPLPEDVDNFIVNTVEPNFTPGLGILLAFSVSLGLFASAQLGSGASVYSEDK